MSKRLSRTMSYALRHDPSNFGLTLDTDGSVNLNEFADALDVPVQDIIVTVLSDDKQRFTIHNDRIWANNGHTVKADVPLTPVTTAGYVYHGTKVKFLDSIAENGGIEPRQRNYVHLSTDVATATDVANRRDGLSVILTIDAGKMIEDGLELVSSGSAVLAKYVPWEYVVNISVLR